MPKPLAAHLSAQSRVWPSGFAAAFLEQFTSIKDTFW
jgi:hypothetical protein